MNYKFCLKINIFYLLTNTYFFSSKDREDGWSDRFKFPGIPEII